MDRPHWAASSFTTLLISFAVTLATCLLPTAGSGQGTPRFGGGSSAGGLLDAAPFDRITLIDGTVINVEPIAPRPLPEIDIKKQRELQRRREMAAEEGPPREGNILLPGQSPAKKKARPSKTEDKTEGEDQEPITKINIRTLEGDIRDFVVERKNIKKIDYFEDMLLAEADRLTRAQQFGKAFEHLLAVELRDPKWKGFREQVNKLLFEEGSQALIDNDTDRGLRLLRELRARQPDYPGLDDKLAASYSGRIAKAFEAGSYLRGRQILHELEQILPDHDTTKTAKARYLAKAHELFQRAQKQTGAERLDLLTEALRVWPRLEEAQGPYQEAFTALPTLDVAVLDLPRSIAPWIRSPAAERVARLFYLPILLNESPDAAKGMLAGQLAASFEKGELGRRFTVQIKPGITWSDGTRPVSAIDLVRALSDRTDPRSPAYNARWADLLQKVQPLDEQKVEVRLSRSVLRPEAWLLGPVGPAHAAWDGWVTTAEGRKPVGDGIYSWDKADDRIAQFRAAPSGGPTGSPKIQRIREIRVPSERAAISALLRGDVTMIEHVPPDRVPELSKNDQIRVGRYEAPVLHRIAIDGRHPALRNRTLRRGLSHAIDRKTILEETILKRPADDVNTVSDGAFAKGSFADAKNVKPLDYDLRLALMLVAAARKEMGGGPVRLNFEYPALAEAKAAAPLIAESFRRAGVEIKLIERPADQLEEELRTGRRFDLAYRVGPCVDPLNDVGPLLCPGYDAPPQANALASVASARTLQTLLQLERAPDQSMANALATTIDRETRDELPILPLWQLEDHFAYRARLKGPGESATHLYQGIDGWEIEPWFAQDPW
jgi:peptide/nickel transport system substrate-binding protein